MANFTAAGTTLYLDDELPTTFDTDSTTGYPGLTFVEVAEVTSIGDFGPSFSVVNHTPLGDRVVSKRKGSVNYGSTTVAAARDESDTGQGAMDTALNNDCPVSFKVEHNDVPCGGGTGTVEYFTGIVTSALSTNLGGPDNIDSVSYTIEIDRPIVKVPAAPTPGD